MGSFVATAQPSLKRTAIAVGAFVLLLWAIWLADAAFELHLARYGVYPRDVYGLFGVLSAPLIHGSGTHVFSNTLPLLVLGTLLFYGYPRSAWIVSAAIYLGSGLGVWLFARQSYHIGASGLTHGLLFFLFVVGILRRDRAAIALSLLVFFLYGSMVWGIFPQKPGVSFEAHLFGALVGLFLAFLFRNRDPRPAERRYSWQDEPEEQEDTEGPDEWKH